MSKGLDRVSAAILLLILVVTVAGFERLNARMAQAPAQGVSAKTETYLPTPLSMRALFETDFGSGGNVATTELTSPDDGHEIDLWFQVVNDVALGTKTLAIYVPDTEDAFVLCAAIAEGGYEDLLNSIGKKDDSSVAVPASDLKPSNVLYIYVEKDLTPSQNAALSQMYADGGITVQFRGRDWQMRHSNDKRKPPT
jgi:hypothetical protein